MAARKVVIRRVGVGSVFKVATILALVGFVAWMLAASLLYFGLQRAGVVDSLNGLVSGVGGDQFIDATLVMSAAGLFGLIGVVFTAVIAPLCAVLYNAIADLVGGVTITMSNRAR